MLLQPFQPLRVVHPCRPARQSAAEQLGKQIVLEAEYGAALMQPVLQRGGGLKPGMIRVVKIGKRRRNAADDPQLVQHRAKRVQRFPFRLVGGKKGGDGIQKLKGNGTRMPFLQRGGEIRPGKVGAAGLWGQLHADPIVLPAFHAEGAAILKINALPGNDTAQRPPRGGAGAGQNGILLNRLPQKLGKEKRQRFVRLPELPGTFKNRQAAQVFLLVENIHGKGALPLQFQQQRLPDVGGHIVQGQEGRHFLHVEGLGIQLQAQLVSQIVLLRNPQIAEIGADEQHGIFKNVSAGLQHLEEQLWRFPP